MKPLKEIWNNSNKVARLLFWITLFVGVCLIVVSFVLPPTGVIDNTVILAVGEIMGFASLGVGFECIFEGFNVKMSHNNTTFEVNNNNN